MNFNDFTKKLDPDYIPSITESIDLEEKNVPTNPALWSRAKALAKKKFDVYPSAYANGWAAKWYKSKGGSWKKEESVEIEEGTPAYRKMMKRYKGSDTEKVFNMLRAKGYKVGEQDDTLVNNLLKRHRGNVKKVVDQIVKDYPGKFDVERMMMDDVQIDEKRDMTKVVGRKVPELSSDAREVLAHAINMSRQGVPGLDVPLATGRNAGKFNDGILISALTFLRNNSSKMTPTGKKYAKEVIKVLGESVEIDEATVDTSHYRSDHGRSPRQNETGGWSFSDKKFGKEFYMSPNKMPYKDAKVEAEKIAKKKGFSKIYLAASYDPQLDESLLDALKKKLSDEGGAAGFKDLEAVAKKMGMDLTPEKLKKMPGIMQHRDGDFILEGFASDAQRRAAFASGYKAKGKKGKKEEVEVDEASEKQMMDMLRKEYGKISKVDPSSPTYKKLTDMLDRLAKSNPQLLKKLADAKIKFVSPLAMNRVNRMKESRDDFSYLDRQAASQDRDFAAKKFMDALKKAGITAKYHRSLGKVEVEKGDLRKAQGIGKRLKVDKEGVRIDGTLNKSYKGVFDQNTNEQIDEMSAKQHYNKMVAQGKVGGQVVSPIDRKRFPNREREGLEGPYRVKKSGLIYYYDKRAGKYYDPQSDMYLDVKDVMEGTYSADSRQSGEEKPLITWMDKFEKALKSMGSSYAKVDPVEALKLYYKGVDPKRAASQLK